MGFYEHIRNHVVDRKAKFQLLIDKLQNKLSEINSTYFNHAQYIKTYLLPLASKQHFKIYVDDGLYQLSAKNF